MFVFCKFEVYLDIFTVWDSTSPSTDKNYSYFFIIIVCEIYKLPDKHVPNFIFIFNIVNELLNF